MSSAHRRYLAIQAAIGGAINSVLSAVFVLLVFHGQGLVETWALVRDALPQTFIVTLMSAVVPSLLTRRRLAMGKVAPLPRLSIALPSHPLARGLVMAAIATAVLVLAQRWLLPTLVGDGAGFGTVLIGKTLYGAALGAIISYVAVRLTLASTSSSART